MPEKVELLLNGRPLVDGRLGVDYTGIAEPADSFIVAGTNVLVMRVVEIPEPGSPEAQAHTDPRRSSYASFSLGISGPGATEWAPTQSFGKNSKEFPIEYTFVVTNAWPVKRLPWQMPAPEFTEKDREEILAILRGIARSCGNLKTEGGKETLYNTLRMEYEHRARLEGVSPEEMKRRIFAIYDRMAPFCQPSVSTFSSWETTPVAGANLVIAKPRKGDRDTHAPDGSYAGNDAARINTKKSSTAISLPNNFSKINGKWQVAPGNYNNEARFEMFERRRGPLEAAEPWRPSPPVKTLSLEELRQRAREEAAANPPPKRYVNSDPPDTSPNAMGYGAPGKILPYKVDAQLAPDLKKYNLSAHWFVRDPFPPDTQSAYFTRQDSDMPSPTNALPFLLFTPKNRGTQKMPILMFVPGNGEIGTDLSLQFRQRTIFEVVTSEEFQRKRPCYLFVPMPPDSGMLRGASPTRLSDHGHLMNDALMNVIATRKSPAVDTERVYLTGLSFGATGAYSFGFVIPDRFAAVVPVSSYGSTNYLHPTRATSFWHFNNEKKASLSPRHDWLMESMKAGIEARGGEFKASTLPDSGHNAWDKAWREEAVWEWMFSKRSKTWDLQWSRPGSMGHPLPENNGNGAAASTGAAIEKEADRNVRAPSSAPSVLAPAALNSDHGADRMLDGLLATWYATTNSISRDEWIQIEYPQPVRGSFTITSGTPGSDAGMIRRGNVETSADGANWTRQASFKNDGACAFKQAESIRFLRIAHNSPAPQSVAIREVKREE